MPAIMSRSSGFVHSSSVNRLLPLHAGLCLPIEGVLQMPSAAGFLCVADVAIYWRWPVRRQGERYRPNTLCANVPVSRFPATAVCLVSPM
jgi:hypothetical protein